MRTKLLLLFFALGEITASAQTDSLPNITKTSNGKLIDPIQIHEVVVTGTRNETDIRHLPMTISVIDRKQIEQSMQPSILPLPLPFCEAESSMESSAFCFKYPATWKPFSST